MRGKNMVKMQENVAMQQKNVAMQQKNVLMQQKNLAKMQENVVKMQENASKPEQTNVLMQQKNVAMQQENMAKIQENVAKTQQTNVATMQENLSTMQQNNMVKIQENVLKMQGNVSKTQQNNMVKMQENMSKIQDNVSMQQNNMVKMQENVSKPEQKNMAMQQKNVEKMRGKNRVKTFGMAALALMLGFVTILGTACSNSAGGGGAKSSINTDNSASSAQTVQTISGESYTPKSTDPAVYTTTEGHQVFRSEAGVNYINYGGSTYEIVAQGAYTPIEWIKSTGAQYIDTGYDDDTTTSVLTKVEMDFKWEPEATGKAIMMASQGGSGLRCLVAKSTDNAWSMSYTSSSTTSPGGTITGSSVTLNQRYLVEASLTGGAQSLNIDGQTVATGTLAPKGGYSRNHFLFANNQWGNANTFAHATLYGCKLWKNGELIRDYIPVKNINGVAGLYDRVNDIFCGSASGTPFIAGPEISYTSIDYIEGTADEVESGQPDAARGHQFINTGYFSNPLTDTIEIKYLYTDLDHEGMICGYNNGNTSKEPYEWWYKLFDRRFGIHMCNINKEDATGVTFTSSAMDTNVHTIKRDKEKIYVDGSLKGSLDTSLMIPTRATIPFGLFGRTQNAAGTSWNYGPKMRMYYCKIWDNDVLVRDFVPCKYQGEVGLFDRVNNKFYGSATGTPFLAPTTETSYTELDYIQSSGTQFINTGYYSNPVTDCIEIRYNLTDTVQHKIFAGYNNGTNSAVPHEVWYKMTSTHNLDINTGSGQLMVGTTNQMFNTDIHTVSRSYAGVVIDGALLPWTTKTHTDSTFRAAVPFGLFARTTNNGGTTANWNAKIKLYYCKIWDNGILLRDFVPVRNSAGKAGLYDKITRQFYGNVGTGTFTAGPVRTTTVTQHVDNSPAGLAIANDPNAGSRKIAPVAGIPINDSIPVGHFLCQRPDGTQILIKL